MTAPVSAPAGYTYALTTIPLHSVRGIYRLTRRKGESTYVQGFVTLNVKDGALNSVTVRPLSGKGKAKNIKRERLSHLGVNYTASEADRLTFAALTR